MDLEQLAKVIQTIHATHGAMPLKIRIYDPSEDRYVIAALTDSVEASVEYDLETGEPKDCLVITLQEVM